MTRNRRAHGVPPRAVAAVAGIALATGLALGLGGTPTRGDEARGPYPASEPARGALGEDPPVAIYSADPQDPWNRLHHLLFAARVDACLYTEGAAAVPALTGTEDERLRAIADYYHRRFTSECRKVTRLEGGDLLELFFGHRAEYLLEEARVSAIVSALAELPKDRRPRGTVARVVFQHDLWNRFDSVFRLADGASEPGRRRQVARLQDALGRAIARLAPRPDEIAGIQPNFSAVARSSPEPGPELFSGQSPWRELVVDTRSQPAVRTTTAHAAAAGHRRVFRIFVRTPDAAGGPTCLAAHFGAPPAVGTCVSWWSVLVEGSRALLLESLLALASNGEIVAVPLVVSVQHREVRPPAPGPEGRFELDGLAVRVLHASRRALAAESRESGGFHPLAPDTPVPVNFAAFGRSPGGWLVPAALACRRCHGLTGANLMSTGLHDRSRVHVLAPLNTVVTDRVIRAKQASPDYRALRKFFQGS